jgi:hypothetical protein
MEHETAQVPIMKVCTLAATASRWLGGRCQDCRVGGRSGWGRIQREDDISVGTRDGSGGNPYAAPATDEVDA